MEDRIRLSYFYGKEADQFSFYKIPKLLFTEEYFKKISVEAKVLYGLMLDRMSLSMKNQWMDDEGRAYIYYSLEDIMEALGCSNKKAISIMKELDTDAGIGLIEKKRQGQGKPTMIYLKQFMVQDVQKCRNFTSEQKAAVSEVKNLHILKCKNAMSRSEEITLPEVKNIHTNPILSEDEDRMGYEKYFMEQLNIEALKQDYPYDREMIDGIMELILDVVCSKRKIICIAGDVKSVNVVKGRFMKLNMEHIRYVMKCMQENTTKIRSIKQYMLAALYNAPATIDSYYRAEVNHDMAEGKI